MIESPYFDVNHPPTKLETEMAALLDLIASEWRSDPMSVQCFDLRIIARVHAALVAFDIQQKKAERERRGRRW